MHIHILPRLGDVRIDRISPQMIEESLRNDLLRSKRLAPQTINKVLGTLTGIFDYAVRLGIAERNPARLAERLRVGAAELAPGEKQAPHAAREVDPKQAPHAAREVDPKQAPHAAREVDPDDVPSPDEVKRTLLAAEPGLFKTYFLTAALTGARSGELLALTWSDVDLDAGAIHIRRTVTWARTREDREAGVRGARFFPPKTKSSRRTVEAPPELVSALKRWKLACPPSDLDLVFPKADGSPMHRKLLRDQGLRRAQAAAGLRHFGVHALRHFFASELIRQGYPPTEVASRLGHSSPAVTLTVYARCYAGATSDAVKNLAKALCEA